MALNAYLKMEGEKSGAVKGSVTQKGREDSIMVIAVEHDVVSPRDAASGLATGKRQHKPFVITKEVDKSTPVLFSILCNNEIVKKWELQFWKPDKTGVEKQHYKVELTNASITGIRFEMLNNKYPENMQFAEREHVAFAYQKITWTWTDGGITAEDDWEAPVV